MLPDFEEPDLEMQDGVFVAEKVQPSPLGHYQYQRNFVNNNHAYTDQDFITDSQCATRIVLQFFTGFTGLY